MCSGGVAVLWAAGAWLLRKTTGIQGPGISVLMRIPGMKALTATPNWTPQGQQELPVTGGAVSGGSKDVLAQPISSGSPAATAAKG